MLLAVAAAGFAVFTGATAWIVLHGLLGIDGAELGVLVGLISTAAAAIAGIFGQPLFSAGLELVLEPPAPPMPAGPELETWTKWLQSAALEKRVRGGESQRDQMLRGGKVMDVTVTGHLDIGPGRGGKPHIQGDGRRQPLSKMVEQWDMSEGRLVILGDPGYGKTFAALSLIDHINHTTDSVAELFPLIDWFTWKGGGQKGQSIEVWLVNQLLQSYPELAETAARAIVANGTLVPIFDGLDEIPEGARAGCRDALEAYAGHNAPFRAFVVTCRQDEYMDLRPRWVGADHHVALSGLSRAEIEATLRASVGDLGRWENVLAAVNGGDSQLVSLLRSPLRLTAALEVFERRDPDHLLSLAGEENAEEQLWDLLLRADRRTFPGADRGDVRRWLSFLAASMRSHDRQRFWLHELYLYTSPKDRRRFHLTAVSLFVAVAFVPWLFHPSLSMKLLGAAFGVFAFVGSWRQRDKPMEHTVRSRATLSAYIRRVPMSAVVGVVSGLIWATGLAPVCMAIFAVAAALEGSPLDVGAAAATTIQFAVSSGSFVAGVLAVIHIVEAGSAVVDEEPPDHFIGRGPGAVIRSTLAHALIVAAGACLLVLPLEIVAWGFVDARGAVTATLIVAWISGLNSWAFYHWTRLHLARAGRLPRRLRRFLDWVAEDTGWLRASDAYEFRHRELLDFLSRGAEPIGAENLSWSESLLARGHDKRAVLVSRHGDSLLTSGDFEGARDAYVAAVDIAPGDPLFRRELAIAYERLRDYEQQVLAARAAVELDPMEAANHSSLGFAYGNLGDSLAALQHAQRASEISPKEPYYQYWHLARLSNFGGQDDALTVLDAAMERGVVNEDLEELRDLVVKRKEECEKSLREAESKVEQSPDDPIPHWSLAVAYRGFAFADESARARLRAVEIGAEGSKGNRQLAWELNAHGYTTDAVQIAETLGEDGRGYERATALAHAYADQGRSEEAAAQIELAEGISETPEQLHSLANALFALGRFDDADGVLDEALSGAPKSHFAFARAKILLAAGELRSARTALEKALRLGDSDPDGFDDPAWLCRVIWCHVAPSELASTVEAVYEAYDANKARDLLMWGFVQATPVSADQTGRDAEKLDAWCAAWARQRMDRGVGAIRSLARQAEALRPVVRG